MGKRESERDRGRDLMSRRDCVSQGEITEDANDNHYKEDKQKRGKDKGFGGIMYETMGKC